MALFKSSNPALGEKAFKDLNPAGELQEVMTVGGAVNKTGFLLLMLLCTSAISWTWFMQEPALAIPYLLGGLIGGFILALVIIFKKEWSPALAPAYALLEGFVLGALSAFYNAAYPGIVVQAVLITVAVFACMLVLYRTGVIKVTDTFRTVIVTATAGIAVVYLLSMLLQLFGFNIPYIHESGLFGIGFSLVVVVVAAMNLALDFDFIEQGVAYRAPKYMEWYAAFGLLVTIVWLYLEILRLLSKLRKR